MISIQPLYYFINYVSVGCIALYLIVQLVRHHFRKNAAYKNIGTTVYDNNIYISKHKLMQQQQQQAYANKLATLTGNELEMATKNKPVYSRDPDAFFDETFNTNSGNPGQQNTDKPNNQNTRQDEATDNPFDNPFFTSVFNNNNVQDGVNTEAIQNIITTAFKNANGTNSTKTEYSKKSASGTTSFTIKTNITINNNDEDEEK